MRTRPFHLEDTLEDKLALAAARLGRALGL
jgi:hypothetical protein